MVGTWEEVELSFQTEAAFDNPYLDVKFWAEFTHESGTVVHRPGFWAGDNNWQIRFTSPGIVGRWNWQCQSIPSTVGLHSLQGSFDIAASSNPGFWRISPGGRSLIHADGTPALLVADTAWALPWRATVAEVEAYATVRRHQGFNAVLVMSLQPDMSARGPRDRTQDEGFDVAFEDLPEGHLTQLNPAYFHAFDQISTVLQNHGLVPAVNPLFFGYGWKGGAVAGPVVPPSEYALYCRYLVARYGARPILYLVSADGPGTEPQVRAGGEEIQKSDAYGQPTGIHYCPNSKYRSHQDADWLDFQWAQTGHLGDHAPERMADMWRNEPPKALANGEPSYENIGETGRASGWWQGHEAWSNLVSGGTMGVVYGAGSLWQWKHRPDEPGHPEWCAAPNAGWKEALAFEGANYVGLVGKILNGLPITDMAPDWQASLGRRGLFVPGKLLIIYLSNGGEVTTHHPEVPLSYRAVDPRTGNMVRQGVKESQNERVSLPTGTPIVVIFHR